MENSICFVVFLNESFPYHQDLDYCDFGDPQASVAAGGGVDERVRDWIVDVERQSSEHLTPMDKYSQKTSSKC